MANIRIKVPNISNEVAELFQRALVWDGHGCMPLRPQDDRFLPQLERYRDAGVNVIALNVGFDAVPWTNAILVLAHFRHWIRQRSDRYLLVEQVEDLDRARADGKLAIMFDLEGGCALNEQLSMIELYRDLGVRWMLLAYNINNSLGGGCQDNDTGLSAFGRKVLDEMARVGMVACCSHTGYRTAREILDHTAVPVIFSHSNPRALRDHHRNISDDLIKSCAATGGVIGINGIGNFLGHNDSRTETIVRHIDYVAQLVGPDHVALGLDYVFDEAEMYAFMKENPRMFPSEVYGSGMQLVRPEQIPEIAEALAQRGYGECDLKNILGQNLLRVARGVWKSPRVAI